MQIHEIIQKQKMYARYCEKYVNPLMSHFNKMIPEKILDEFLGQATIEEIVLYYMGYCNVNPDRIPSILVSLERHKGINIPVTEGILSQEYWWKWTGNNLLKIIDQAKIFGKG